MGKVNFINKNNLIIARENVGLDDVRASRSVSQSGKNLVSLWESGDELPTWAQAKTLAKKYNVPELVFFSKTNIKKNKIIPDFRVGVDPEEKDDIKKLIHLVLKRQQRVEKILKEEGYPKNNLLGSGISIIDPVKLASKISEELEIDIEEIKNISGAGARKKTLKYLIEKAEDKAIFVGKTLSYNTIPVDNMRGLFIANDYCPYIILNRQDAISAQIFSLIHEFAHLFRKSESISNNIDIINSDSKINKEETFCNKVAANLLLPAKEFEKNVYNKSDIKILSEKYKLSELFIFYRLKELKKINQIGSVQLEKEFKKESAQNVLNKKKNQKSGGNYYNNMRDSNGSLLNRIVSSSYLENKINYVEASNILSFSVENA